MLDEADQVKFREIIDLLGKQIGTHITEGEAGITKARSILARVADQVNNMPESEWKREYKKAIEDRFGYLITRLRAISLDELVEDDG